MFSHIVKRSLPFCFFCILLTQANAQTSKLLWYTGKKLSDTSLQISGGTRVSYSPSRNLVRITPASGGVAATIAARLKTREKFKQQVIKIISQGPAGPRNIHAANLAATTIDEVDRSFEKVVGGAQEIKLENMNGPVGNARAIPIWVQNNFDEVVNYVITEKSKQKTDPPPPPVQPFDYCFPCDEDRKSQYAKDTAAYFREFFDEHARIIPKGFSVIRYFEHCRIKGLPFDSAAAQRMIPKMEKDILYLMNETSAKILKAWNLYRHNATRIPVLTQMLISAARQFELMGYPMPEGYPGLGELGDALVESITKQFEEAGNRRDYPVLLNISWLTGLLRQIALIHGNETGVPENIGKFLRNNRFEMEVDAEARIGKGDDYINIKMKGSNTYAAVPDKDCKLRWHLVAPDEKRMLFQLDKAEMTLGKGGKYTGTRDWYTTPAKIELGFCEEPARDTLLVENFQSIGEESWVIDGIATPGQFVRSTLFSSFMDEKRVRAAAADKAMAERMSKEIMDQYKKNIAGNEALLKKDPATMTPEERERLAKLASASQDIQNKMVSSAAAFSLLLKESLKNNLKTVFESELDGKVLFPKNTAIQHAKYKVKLIHVEDEGK
ncbi:MAG TPA: hypothetical protein VD996_11605 [Chitinophagaceae bacterium]|nr:hypothetical protein [Chitinophagaceae bacterium]